MKSRIYSFLQGTHWLLLAVFAALFLSITFIGTLYHPWDTVLEESGVALLDYKNLADVSQTDGNGNSEQFFDRVDQVKYNIYRILFSDEANGILTTAAKYLLAPVEDTAKLLSLAAAYGGMNSSFSNSSVALIMILFNTITFFLLFYFFKFGTGKVVFGVMNYLKSRGGCSHADRLVISYCMEGVSAFLVLFVTYWARTGINILSKEALPGFFGIGFSSGNTLIAIPVLLLFIGIMVFFVLLIIAALICIFPYYFLMAVPVFLVAWLPLWIFMPVKLFLCFVLEVILIGKLFPWLYERLMLWNVIKGMLYVIARILGFLFHPIRFFGG